MKRGMVLGKFLPPHLGHLYLGEFARQFVDDLTIVVGTLRAEPIPGQLRFHWMRELFPFDNVVHLDEELPQHPEEHPCFWEFWRDALLRVLPAAPDYVFASESYGEPLARLFGAQFVAVDPARTIVSVSGTAIRANPMTYWNYLPRCVRPYFVRRVCVFGPESTGKTTLAANLARSFDTVWAPEYARVLIESQNGRVESADMERIARGQAASEDALALNANRLLLCDTDLLTTHIWNDVLFQQESPWIRQAADSRDYDLYLLLDVDVPWIDDVVRYRPDDRATFFNRCRLELETRGRRFVEIRGDWNTRFTMARAAIEQLMTEPPSYPPKRNPLMSIGDDSRSA